MNQKAKKIIKDKLKEKNITYKELSSIMEKKGYIYNDNTIRSKISRGKFSFVFLLEVCDSLEINIINLNE